MSVPRPRTPAILGRLLVEEGALTAEALESALVEQRESKRRLGEILVARGVVGPEAVARTLAAQLGLPYVPPPLSADPTTRVLVRPALARERRVLPLAISARSLRLAMADPLDLGTLDDVRFQTGRRIEPVVASGAAVDRALTQAYGESLAALAGALPARAEEPARRNGTDESLEEASRSAPVVRLVDHMLERAVEERATSTSRSARGTCACASAWMGCSARCSSSLPEPGAPCSRASR